MVEEFRYALKREFQETLIPELKLLHEYLHLEAEVYVTPFGSPRWISVDIDGKVYAMSHAYGYDVYISEDRGKTWRGFISGSGRKPGFEHWHDDLQGDILSIFPTMQDVILFWVRKGYSAYGLWRLDLISGTIEKVLTVTNGNVRSYAESRDGTLYIVLDEVDPVVVYRSKDGGKTWEKVYEKTLGSTGYRWMLAGLDDWGVDYVWLVTETGLLAWSGNYGDTWTEFPTFEATEFGGPGICYVPGGDGLAVNSGQSVFLVDWWDPSDPSKIWYVKLPTPKGTFSIEAYGGEKGYLNPIESDEFGNIWAAYARILVCYPSPYYYAVPILSRRWNMARQTGKKLAVSLDGYVYVGIADVVVESLKKKHGAIIRIKSRPWWGLPKPPYNLLYFGTYTIRDTNVHNSDSEFAPIRYIYDIRGFSKVRIVASSSLDQDATVTIVQLVDKTRDAYVVSDSFTCPAGGSNSLTVDVFGIAMIIRVQCSIAPTTGSITIYGVAKP